MPWQFFPGIFSSIDSYTKRVVGAHFAVRGRVPFWVPLGEPIECPHWSRFARIDSATQIRLCGAPDEMLRLPTGRLGIYDYKTARHTDHQDELLPIYTVQLNAYAWLAERLGYGVTEQLALIYCEPLTDDAATRLLRLTSKGGFALRFTASLVPVTVEPMVIPDLLARARNIFDLAHPPPALLQCKDCGKLENLLLLLGDESAD